ncbi:hypothetical protein [Brevundimonas sp. DC300-4]|uniref:variant leucine-rich repeat-containing protein n=1 Tax=Brevundimonas sp. DC300-4 TaxID=2804594 RepID=UPI003CEF4C77
MKPTKAELREAASEQTPPQRLAELAVRDKTLARAVASNCAAPAELLDTLSEHQDKAIRKRVVRNPATLAKTVAKAGGEFPSDLLDNPAFDLYLIEQPDMLTDFGEATLRALLKRENCPAGFFAYAAKRGDTVTRLTLLMNPAATTEAIEIVRKNGDRSYNNPAWAPSGALIEACDLHRSSAGDLDWRARLTVGLEQARGDDRPKPEQFALAEVGLMLDGTTAATLGQPHQASPISRILYSSLHIDLAANPATPAHVLAGLARNENTDVRKAVALNPSTTPDVLGLLATDAENPDIREAVALNPNITPEILNILVADSEISVRSAVAKNPSTSFQLLQLIAFDDAPDPQKYAQWRLAGDRNTPLNLLEHISRSTHRVVLNSLISNPAASAELLIGPLERLVGQNVQYDVAVATHRYTPPHVLESLAAKKYRNSYETSWLRSALAANRSLPPYLFAALVAEDESEQLRATIARNRACPEELLLVLAAADSISIQNAVYCNPKTPFDVKKALQSSLERALEEMALNGDRYEKIRLAEDRFTPPGILEALAGSDNVVIRRTIAKRKPCTQALLEALSKDDSAGVRYAIAGNRATPPHVLEALAKDQNPCIRWMVAENSVAPPALRSSMPRGPVGFRDWFRGNVNRLLANDDNTPPHVLEILASDYDKLVRYCVAYHNFTPSQALEILARDGECDAREAVARHPTTPSQALEILARDGESEVRKLVAGHPTTPLQVIEILARDEDASVRGGVAQNPNAPERLLDLLARDGDADVREEMASHETAPERILDALARDEAASVRRHAAWNSNAPERLLDVLARDVDNEVRRVVARHPAVPSQALEILARDEDASVRRAVARHPTTPSQALEILARDGESEVRQLVAVHPTTPLQVIEILARDEVAFVRGEVTSNWSTPPGLLQSLALDEVRHVAFGAKAALKRRFRKKLSEPSKNFKELEHKLVALGGSPVSGSSEWELRKLLIALKLEAARNPYAPVDQLNVLARDEDIGVRVEVARNPSASANLLAKLALDSARIVRANAACNPSYAGTASGDVAIAEGLQPTFRLGLTNAGRSASKHIEAAKAAADPIAAARELKVGWIKDLTRTTRPGISRLAALAQPECPPDALARAQRSSWWLERCVIAANPATPLSALRGLAKDGNAVVQAAALEALAVRSASSTG